MDWLLSRIQNLLEKTLEILCLQSSSDALSGIVSHLYFVLYRGIPTDLLHRAMASWKCSNCSKKYPSFYYFETNESIFHGWKALVNALCACSLFNSVEILFLLLFYLSTRRMIFLCWSNYSAFTSSKPCKLLSLWESTIIHNVEFSCCALLSLSGHLIYANRTNSNFTQPKTWEKEKKTCRHFIWKSREENHLMCAQYINRLGNNNTSKQP